MVNKSLLALAAFVAISVFGVGVFVGVQAGGGGNIAGPAESTPTPAGTPTAEGTAAGTPSPTPTATPVPTPTPTPEPIPVGEFNESDIRSYIVQYLNENRTEQGLDTVGTEGRTAETVGQMSQNHSEAMAAEGRLAHTINNISSQDRYEAYGIASRCSFDTTETPSDNELEAIAMTVAGQSYTEDGQRRFNANDSAVARTLVDRMLADDTYRERLLQPTPTLVGVGVAITDSGEVYATVNTCA